jgi:hypothetical protein
VERYSARIFVTVQGALVTRDCERIVEKTGQILVEDLEKERQST